MLIPSSENELRAIEISERPKFIPPTLFPPLLNGGGIPFNPCVATGGGGPLPIELGWSLFNELVSINPPINPANPGFESAIEFTAAV